MTLELRSVVDVATSCHYNFVAESLSFSQLYKNEKLFEISKSLS